MVTAFLALGMIWSLGWPSNDTCLTTDGDVVRSSGGRRGRHPLSDRLPRGIEHQVCEGKSAIIHSHQPEAPVIFPCCSFQLQQPACKPKLFSLTLQICTAY